MQNLCGFEREFCFVMDKIYKLGFGLLTLSFYLCIFFVGPSLSSKDQYMYVRTAETIIKEFSKMFPAVVIVGPRQSGKTTLARTMFPHLPYLTFEDFDIRSYATKDPRGFLLEYRAGAILDEVQNVPQLLSYLQGVLDSNREKGRFVLTGSHNLLLNSQIFQSLPGRVGIVTLFH